MTSKGLDSSGSQPDLAGKVAIVTGAASGIGRATALLLEERGAQVIAEDINTAVNELGSNKHILPFVGDVASEDSAKRVVALAIERFGKLDILVEQRRNDPVHAPSGSYARGMEQHSLRESNWRLPPL